MVDNGKNLYMYMYMYMTCIVLGDAVTFQPSKGVKCLFLDGYGCVGFFNPCLGTDRKI